MSRIDRIDIKLLQLLQKNARMTIKELAAEVNLSPTPVYERVKHLESEGYIRDYVAVLEPEKLGLGLMAFVIVKLSRQDLNSASSFIEKIKEIDYVEEAFGIAGTFDYLLKVRCHDMNAYRTLIIDALGNIETVKSIESVFVLREVKTSCGIPLRLE